MEIHGLLFSSDPSSKAGEIWSDEAPQEGKAFLGGASVGKEPLTGRTWSALRSPKGRRLRAWSLKTSLQPNSLTEAEKLQLPIALTVSKKHRHCVVEETRGGSRYHILYPAFRSLPHHYLISAYYVYINSLGICRICWTGSPRLRLKLKSKLEFFLLSALHITH